MADLVTAETYTPALLRRVIIGLENATHSREVWALIVGLGREVGLPYIDFISASSFKDWRKTLFIRTSYQSDWLQVQNADPDVSRWSYFRSHAMHYLTPLMVGLEYADEYRHLPQRRIEVLKMAADRGMRAGISFPLRQNAPPQAALLSFIGNHDKAGMQAILDQHGWTLNVAALMAHQRYVQLFNREFTERNHITDKQKELIELIGLGLQDKAIADRLGVSVSAIRQRMNALFQNTGLQSRAELAALAMSIGILPDPFHRPDAPSETLVEADIPEE
ncbi:helix-turn-helix transcriptional regulator [Pseudoprimorskyibacter insulae]|uniref:HTH luxR-type domain-containing protein n=1 Tax=Pseudoprimorskyibacter insulae TaxID=1695997 RepID=A0A2R8AV13_9RHOB|nr:autoinducer binding domain-containing protein [Pseudoprimorskyibacter insulae]SPF79840.1 hypothetical protein PRI8871_01640 [Pseudoprimorskyibacter insulae]